MRRRIILFFVPLLAIAVAAFTVRFAADEDVEATINALQQGLTNIPAATAVDNINMWQSKLEGSSDPTLMRIVSDLEQLEMELQRSSIRGSQVGRLLVALGQRTSVAAVKVDDVGTARELAQLGSLLAQSGRSLLGIPEPEREPLDETRMEMEPDVTVSGTLQALQGGLTAVPMDAALQNIQDWQMRLRAANDPAFDPVITNLEALEAELRGGSIDGERVGTLLMDLGEQTVDAAAMASGGAADELRDLGNLLQQAAGALM